MKTLFHFNTLELLLISIISALFLIQMLYYFIVYRRIYAQYKKEKKGKLSTSNEYPPVSVIVTTNDEAQAIEKNLPLLLAQDYPNYEVIVVNNCKNNHTTDVLTLMDQKYEHLYHTFTPDSARYISQKKLAITLGIKASKNEWLLFTDANCAPKTNQWIKQMAHHFTEDKSIVLGYAGYRYSKEWIHRKIHIDQLFFSMQYLGMALLKRPFIGLGKNMAFRKSLFYQEKGFNNFLQLRAGADDLFINRTATKKNTAVETSYEGSICIDSYYSTWKEEKLSYVASSHYYKGGQKTFLHVETLTRYLFYIISSYTLVFSILEKNWIVTGIVTFFLLLRFIIQALIIQKTCKSLKEKSYLWSLPIWDIVVPITQLKMRLIRIIRGEKFFMRKI